MFKHMTKLITPSVCLINASLPLVTALWQWVSLPGKSTGCLCERSLHGWNHNIT